MWRWEDEQMWRWADVKMRRWADERMRRCEDEKMWRCEDEKMRRCEDEKMRRWEDEKMWRWEDVRWRWEDVKMRRCEDMRMWRWEDVKMRMWRCEDVRMRRWEDANVWHTPTIRRTLRSDALGKNWEFWQTTRNYIFPKGNQCFWSFLAQAVSSPAVVRCELHQCVRRIRQILQQKALDFALGSRVMCKELPIHIHRPLGVWVQLNFCNVCPQGLRNSPVKPYNYILGFASTFIYLFIRLSMYLSVYLSMYLSIYLPIYLSVYGSIYLSIYLSIYYLSIYYLSIYLPIYLPIYLSISQSINQSTNLSIYLHLYLYGILVTQLAHTRQELDHCSGPSGTESNNMQLNKTFRGGVLGLAPCHVDRKIKLQARLHSNLDGPSLAHAIQVPMGPLQD